MSEIKLDRIAGKTVAHQNGLPLLKARHKGFSA